MRPDSLRNNIVYLSSTFTHHFNQVLFAQFRKHKMAITPEQFGLLVLLWYKDGLTQKEIAEELNRDKTTITRVIANMKKAKLIKQEVDAIDTRAKRIYITAKGRKLQEQGIEISGDLYIQVTNGISAEKLKTGIEVLQNMIGNI